MPNYNLRLHEIDQLHQIVTYCNAKRAAYEPMEVCCANKPNLTWDVAPILAQLSPSVKFENATLLFIISTRLKRTAPQNTFLKPLVLFQTLRKHSTTRVFLLSKSDHRNPT